MTLPIFNLTDSGNAELFASLYAGKVLFDHKQQRWLLWNDKRCRWQVDKESQVRLCARNAARQRFTWAAELPAAESDKRNAAMSWASESESSFRIETCLKEAKAEPGIADSGEQWDTDPMLLGVANGILNLKTGELRPGQPEDRITQFSPVKFDSEARCPLFEKFVSEVFEGDLTMIRYIQRIAGYSLTGDVSEKAVFVHHGEGDNGKTTLMKIIGSVLGRQLSAILNASALDSKHQRLGDGHDLPGKRMAICEETKKVMVIDEARFKLWSGTGVLKCRGLYKDDFEYQPQFKIWIGCNDKPIIRDMTPAMWDRIHTIEYKCRFVEHPTPTGKQKQIDRHLSRKLRAELPGILNWMLVGCLDWQRQGLNRPKEVIAATADYESASDPFNGFLSDCCELDPTFDVPKHELATAYEKWCKDHKECPLNRNAFPKALVKRGVVDANKGQYRVWRGLKLAAPKPPPPTSAIDDLFATMPSDPQHQEL